MVIQGGLSRRDSELEGPVSVKTKALGSIVEDEHERDISPALVRKSLEGKGQMSKPVINIKMKNKLKKFENEED